MNASLKDIFSGVPHRICLKSGHIRSVGLVRGALSLPCYAPASRAVSPYDPSLGRILL